MTELLLQSHRVYDANSFVLYLLPALPAAFADGSVKGLCARGAFTVDMTWHSGALVDAQILSRAGCRCIVRGAYTVLCGDTPVKADFTDGLTAFDTVCGETYTLIPN